MAQSRNSKRRSSRKRRSSSPRPPVAGSAVPPAGTAAPRGTPPPAAPKRSGVPSIKAPREEAPQPIWAPLPVTEGLILLGLVVAVVGLIRRDPPMVLAGLVVVMLPSLELAVREHRAGFRSHSSLLAGVVALLVGPGGGFLLHVAGVGDVPPLALLAVAAVVFAVGFSLLRRAFRRRSGGLSFRV